MSTQGSDTGYSDLMKRALLKLQDAQSKLDAHERERHEGIAIVGIGCRFPGGAVDPSGYWRLLDEGVDTVTEVPPDRWNADSFYHPDPDQPGGIYCRYGSFLWDIDQFAPRFFGISPREAARMDPQHRLLLEVAWEAMERSGRSPSALHGTRTGVFIGMMGQDYTQLATQSPELIDAHTGAGNGASVASGRLSYTFGFQGPSLTVDTACSSSLVAVHLAMRSLRQREVDFALAGGVNLLLSPVATLIESRTHMLSPDGRCKTFDAEANGIGRGEGCGLVLLRRLSDALKDGDPIIAVLRGSAVNQDGRTSGLTVPNGLAQQAVIRDALKDARVEAPQVGYVEAHGTGTALGDPIELEAIASVYGDKLTRKQPLVVGSVKTNLGHLEGAAGIAGLIKSALCLANGEIPPHLHLRAPTPHVDWSRLFVEVPTQKRSWQGSEPRFAAVSSFGFSGTNAHVILESAPRSPEPSRRVERPLHLLALSARSDSSLRRLAESLADTLSGEQKEALADVCYTANVGRSALEERVAFVASTSEEMTATLRAFGRGESRSPATWVKGRREAEVPRVAFLFTGQGAQYVGMGRELFETQPDFRRELLRYEAILRPHLDRPLTELLFQEDSQGALNETRYTQPALVALELALAHLLRSWGVRADAVLGHSVGEYAAAVFAGALEPEEGLPLVAERARLMQGLPERGAMLSLPVGEARAVQALAGHPRVTLAAINGPRNTVISGDETSIDAIARELASQGIEGRRLNVSHAFHSPLMQPMLGAFEGAAARVRFQRPQIDLISNLDGAEAGEAITKPAYWSRHVLQPVRFAEGIRTLVRRGVRIFLEIGPKPALSNLAQEAVTSEEGLWLETLHPRHSDWEGLLRSLAELSVRGMGVDWERFDGGYGRKKAVLPTYPFERQRYWLDVPAPWTRPGRRFEAHPLLGSRWDSAALREGTTVFSQDLTAGAVSLLADHRVYGKAVVPAAAFLEMVAAAAAQVLGTDAMALEDVSFQQPLILPDQQVRAVQTILESQGEAGFTCTVVSKGEGPSEERRGMHASWTTHLTCRVSALRALHPPVELETWRRSCPSAVSIDELSAAIRQRGLEYGPSLQVLSSLYRGPHAALSLSQVEERGKVYRIHPALFDASLRTAAAVTPLTPGDVLHLPVAIQKLELYGTLPERIWTHAEQRDQESPAGLPITDMTLCAEDGAVVAALTGLSVRKAGQEVLLRGLDSDFSEWMYRMTWSPCDAAEKPRPSGQQHWVIFTDEGGFGNELMALLSQRGDRFTPVRKGREFSSSPDGFQLNPEESGHFKSLIASCGNEPVSGFLYLWGLDGSSNEEPSLTGLEAAQVTGCVGALYLTQALARASWSAMPRLILVTRGTQRLASDGQGPRIAQAPLWGFGQAVATELPELRCLRVDLAAEPRLGDLGTFIRALSLPGSEAQLAVRNGALHAARVERTRLRTGAAKKVAISAASSYLIAGGLGGLGLRLARWLVDRGAQYLVLLGRSGPSPEAQRQIEALEAKGVRVQVALADLASHEEVAAVLAGLRSAPPLRGIFHSAGVLRDGTIGNQTSGNFHEVLAPKVQGAWNLHLLSSGMELDFFVCFSSVASLIGTPGQSNYVAANAFLDALAHLRHAQGKPAITINWGSWAEAGMAARLERAEAGRPGTLGFGAIPVEQGLSVLEQLLGSTHAQLGVFPVDWTRLTEQLPGLASQALVRAFVRGVPLQNQPPVFLQQWELAPPNRRMELLRQHVTKQVAVTLGMAESDKISGGERLFELGVDSLLAVELKNRLASSLGKSLRSTLVFDFPTVNGLVAHLAGELGMGGEFQKQDKSSEQAQDALAAEIQGLSEQELTSLIDQELESALTR
ncbi:type I polyketide synthase [Stigmatella aurantiaca]|uniref:CrpB-like protein n=1 Tax=Stigmatella aurantiaca (strain DW4/3-1) TaxID=378806 RepID=Q091C2_STIAD|nr:type I polyketide synthase [Stigmatella aurantiaca]ADO72615.1 CrpB-like protein [Stigmatella aurantiaca DW4/3-1]EAU66333.1 oxidoreductase, short chain dehydrogenase/reductase family [Stigmatella aurantiaca DW4/3-1]CAQ34919.1 TPA: polyketide synthase [Stigmatella aurantiaca DW4/3-1]